MDTAFILISNIFETIDDKKKFEGELVFQIEDLEPRPPKIAAFGISERIREIYSRAGNFHHPIK
jgi:hypothetical protein